MKDRKLEDELRDEVGATLCRICVSAQHAGEDRVADRVQEALNAAEAEIGGLARFGSCPQPNCAQANCPLLLPDDDET